MFNHPAPPRISLLSTRHYILVACAVLVLSGCQPAPEITHEKRPRLDSMQRFLGAMAFQSDDKIWFFTLKGDEIKVDAVKADFERFVRSLRFHGTDPVTWDLPAGWVEKKSATDDKQKKSETLSDGERFATLILPGNLQLTVVPMGGRSASILANVNRWRGQIGLHSLGAGDVDDFYHLENVDNVKVAIVDMLGPGAATQVAQMPINIPAPADKPAPFKYETPQGWKTSKGSAISLLSFTAGEPNAQASITVTAAAGQAIDKVNRWRDQVGLGALSAEEYAKNRREIEIGGAKGIFVDADAGPMKQRIMGAILPQGNGALFFKMMGPSEAVGQQQPAFEAFLKSIQF